MPTHCWATPRIRKPIYLSTPLTYKFLVRTEHTIQRTIFSHIFGLIDARMSASDKE